LVQNLELKIKFTFRDVLLKADAAGGFMFEREFAQDVLLALRSLVISSLFSVSL
jgi:hypothetical protein